MEENLPESAFSMRFGRLIMKYRFATLMTLLSLALFFAFPLVNAAYFNFTAQRSETGEGKLLFGSPARFRMDANVRKTFPEHPYIHAQDKFAGKFGSASTIAIVAIKKDGEIYDYDFLEKVSRITNKLDEAPNVNHYQVRSLTHVNTRVMTIQPDGAIEATPLIEETPEDPQQLAKLKDKVLENPGTLYGQLVSRDHRACFITAGFITQNLDNREAYTQLFNYLRNLKAEEEADGTAEIYISGAPMATGYVIDSQFQIVYYLLVTIVALFFLLLAYFRRLHGVAIPMVAGLATSIWGMGFCAWVGITLDPLVLVIPLLITARSISHTIQMAERFFEDYEMACKAGERRLGRALSAEELEAAKVETATTAMAKLMLPGMLGILADAAGLAVCFLTTIQTMRDLSIFGSFWVVAIIFNVIMLHPIMISYLPPPHDFHHFTPAWMQRFLAATGRIATGPVSKRVLVGGTAFGLVLATWYVLYHTTIGESRPGSPVFWPDHPYNVATGKIGETFGGVDQMTIFVDGDGKSASSDGLVLQRMEAMQRFMKRYVDVGQTVSLVDVIKQYWLVNHYNDPKWGFVPDSAQTIGGIVFQLQQNSSPGFLRPYLTDDAEDANITFYFRDHKGTTIKRAVHYAQEFIEQNPMGRINVRLVQDRGEPLDAAYYLVGPVLFPRHSQMTVQVADINEDQKITGYQTKRPLPVGKWSDSVNADEVLTHVAAALQAQSRTKLGPLTASEGFKDLGFDAERLEKVAEKLSADHDYRIETVDRSAADAMARFATVGELVRYIVERSKFYVDEEWKTDEGNIRADDPLLPDLLRLRALDPEHEVQRQVLQPAAHEHLHARRGVRARGRHHGRVRRRQRRGRARTRRQHPADLPDLLPVRRDQLPLEHRGAGDRVQPRDRDHRLARLDGLARDRAHDPDLAGAIGRRRGRGRLRLLHHRPHPPGVLLAGRSRRGDPARDPHHRHGRVVYRDHRDRRDRRVGVQRSPLSGRDGAAPLDPDVREHARGDLSRAGMLLDLPPEILRRVT